LKFDELSSSLNRESYNQLSVCYLCQYDFCQLLVLKVILEIL